VWSSVNNLPRLNKKHQETSRNIQKRQETSRNNKKHPETTRNNKKHQEKSKNIRKNQESTELSQSCHWGQVSAHPRWAFRLWNLPAKGPGYQQLSTAINTQFEVVEIPETMKFSLRSYGLIMSYGMLWLLWPHSISCLSYSHILNFEFWMIII
jgi:hypothetical protein